VAARAGDACITLNHFEQAIDRVIGGLEKKNKVTMTSFVCGSCAYLPGMLAMTLMTLQRSSMATEGVWSFQLDCCLL